MEMEVMNLLITKRGDIVEKLLKSYSTSEADRMKLVENIVTSDTPLKIDFKLTDESSINRKILNSHFNVLGLKLLD